MIVKNKKRIMSRNVKIGAGLAAIAIVAIAGIFWMNHTSASRTTNTGAMAQQTSATTNGKPHTDLSPATADDQKASDQQKDAIVAQKQQANQSGNTAAAPVITFSGYQQSDSTLQVGAFVPGVVEDGGTCKLTATNGSNTTTDTSVGVRNASNTNCTFAVARNKFPASGSWAVSVSYSSSSAQTANSESQKVNIP